ncbi:hypothetical protein ABZY90_28525 [Streptomyces sp. NPDC006422]|uniref:hypothetical protein n=1 Tax=unclassified Streptomyces TaxID=2593676 RepID=UPI0033BADF0B
MPRPGPAARLTVHLPSPALWHHRPAYAEIAGLGDILAVTGHATLDRVEVYRPR